MITSGGVFCNLKLQSTLGHFKRWKLSLNPDVNHQAEEFFFCKKFSKLRQTSPLFDNLYLNIYLKKSIFKKCFSLVVYMKLKLVEEIKEEKSLDITLSILWWVTNAVQKMKLSIRDFSSK